MDAVKGDIIILSIRFNELKIKNKNYYSNKLNNIILIFIIKSKKF